MNQDPLELATRSLAEAIAAQCADLVVQLTSQAIAQRAAAIAAGVAGAAVDPVTADIEAPGEAAEIGRQKSPPRAKPHPVSVYWSKFTPEERSAILRERRRKGLQKKERARHGTEVIPFPKAGTNGLRVVDLFCGAGGSTSGWSGAGYEVVLGVDNSDAALETYRANHRHDAVKLDLAEVGRAAKVIARYQPDIIVGSPPCTDFSPAGRRIEGPAADLTRSSAEIVEKVRPRIFVLENVPQVRRSRAYADACAILRRAGYGLSMAILDASRCGVPQRRKRLFLVGMIGAREGWADLTEGLATTPLSLRAAFGAGFPHHHYRHPCNSQRRAIFSADQPSPTIRGTNRPMPSTYVERLGDSAPPTDARVLTAKERATVQTFPCDYDWRGTKTEIELQIGNAVPPKMASHVAMQIARAIEAANRSDGLFKTAA